MSVVPKSTATTMSRREGGAFILSASGHDGASTQLRDMPMKVPSKELREEPRGWILLVLPVA